MEPDHQSVYTVVKLIITQPIVGTYQEITKKNPELHQMHYELVTLVKFWHQWPEIKLSLLIEILIKFLSPIQMVEVKSNPMEVNTNISRESKLVLLPEVNSWILIKIFLLGGSNMLTLMRVTTEDILPPHFLPLDLTTH